VASPAGLLDLLVAALAGLALVVSLAWGARRAVRALHMLQLDSYANDRLLRWLGAAPGTRLFAPRPAAVLGALLALTLALSSWTPPAALAAAVLAAWVIAGTLLLVRHPTPAAKKPLVFTGRARRILGVAIAVLAVVAVAAGYAAMVAAQAGRPVVALVAVLVGGLALTQLSPLAVVLANLALAPVQAAINHAYLVRARRRLGAFGPTVVGITGSYGKTTTKYIVATILAERLDVLMTPHSYNTLMGVTRTINETLRPEHRVFVVEMGAYRPGDIRELAELTRPTIGILTAIGPQHLERFGTLERIERTKYELIQGLRGDGIALFNADDPRCARLADGTTDRRVVRYGVAADRSNLDVWAEDVETSSEGSTFALATRDAGRIAVRTRLLGRHNILNILAGAGVALQLGLRLDEIAAGVAKLEPAPHRLQPIAGAPGVTVIDDSYNSNVVGSMEALAVLESFKTGRRVLVTPGMVELGELEAVSNERLGARAAEVCDYIVLVGSKQTEAIARGARGKDFAPERLRVVGTLGEATEVLRTVLRPGDVVLFENDLPDLYLDGRG
jgi:UDP-N-acetylmuramoyl-tripeptide--D-alanyl-D-alanine ligase